MTDKYIITTDKWGDVPTYPMDFGEVVDTVNYLRWTHDRLRHIRVHNGGGVLVDEAGDIVAELADPGPEVK
jgi:hypothetical protein